MPAYFQRPTKVLSLIFGLAIFATLSSSLMAVDCSQPSITLNTQSEVNNFQTAYGGGSTCDVVTGMLTITGADIVDLSPLSELTNIGDNFYIQSTTALTTLDGLSSLARVGGQFLILDAPALTNLDGLSALVEVKDILLADNSALMNLDGLSALTGLEGSISISGLSSLTNLNGLSSLTSLGGFLQIQGCPLLTDFDGLSSLTTIGVSSFNFGLMLSTNAALTNLDGLSALTSVVGTVSIWGNSSLTNLNGLSAVTSIGGTLQVVNNPQLSSLGPLSSITSLGGGLRIENNAILTHLDGLSALSSVSYGMEITSNAALMNLDGLSALISVGHDVLVSNNPSLSACSGLTVLLDSVDDGNPGPGPGVAGIPDVNGDVALEGNLQGCNSVYEIVGMTDEIMKDGFEALAVSVVRLNDTGITWGGNFPEGNNPDCTGETIAGQDCSYGRDVTHNDGSDGHAGFSFTKLDDDGSELSADAAAWSCVRDNVTGLAWEAKTDDNGLRDIDNTYTWYNPDESENGGSAGTANGGACIGSDCDTAAYVNAVNAQTLCGHSDWRMPWKEELRSIVDYGRFAPAIDTQYFPLAGDITWSGSPFGWEYARTISFWSGTGSTAFARDTGLKVRLVRSDPLEHANGICTVDIKSSTPTSEFTDHGDGTVTHERTGLMWKKCAEGLSGSDCATGTTATYNWADALQLALGHEFVAYDDWRLPNVKELASIQEESCTFPAMNSAVFPNSPPVGVWSSSPFADTSTVAWFVHLGFAYDDSDLREATYGVRLVRDGQ